jgi:hypothetical protein
MRLPAENHPVKRRPYSRSVAGSLDRRGIGGSQGTGRKTRDRSILREGMPDNCGRLTYVSGGM